MAYLGIRALFATQLLALSGCLSPTLPLPPPDAPTSVTENTSNPPGTEADARHWLVRGGSTAGAVVLIRNAATGRIFGVEDANFDGRYTIAVEADACDLAEVWEVVGDVSSTRTEFLIVPTLNSVADETNCTQP